MEKGAFEQTTVRWERGHPVTLVIFDREDTEVERHDVEAWGADAVREALQTRGFHHTTAKLPTRISISSTARPCSSTGCWPRCASACQSCAS